MRARRAKTLAGGNAKTAAILEKDRGRRGVRQGLRAVGNGSIVSYGARSPAPRSGDMPNTVVAVRRSPPQRVKDVAFASDAEVSRTPSHRAKNEKLDTRCSAAA